MERINVGMHVDIRRSDGRVHNAVISEVRKGTQSVTVEWFESGETKGKEVDLKTLLSINPMLAAPPSTSLSMNFVAPAAATNDENRSAPELHSKLTNNNAVENKRRETNVKRINNGAALYTARNGNGPEAGGGGVVVENNRASLLPPPARPQKQQQRFTLNPSCFEAIDLPPGLFSTSALVVHGSTRPGCSNYQHSVEDAHCLRPCF
ncbi:unnamed protein product [Gongylonema pulchrum]|uniref:Kinesin motor domain-containing protein n=1 Tax=Gongylonema pulchrum TaxID=637853 RepID=A0A183E1S3_9BILA|nr:unnamed protein product [Gongylonema pulchrum]